MGSPPLTPNWIPGAGHLQREPQSCFGNKKSTNKMVTQLILKMCLIGAFSLMDQGNLTESAAKVPLAVAVQQIYIEPCDLRQN